MKKIVLVILLIPLMFAGCVSDRDTIKDTVGIFLEARWKLLLNYNTPIEDYYDLVLESSLPEIQKDKEIIKKHLIDPRSKEGITIHNVRVVTRIDSINIKGNSAEVRATVEEVELDEQIGEEKYTSFISGIEHDINLVKKNGKWLITSHKSYDIFSQLYD
ncbi:MAG: hypothetical protein KGZ63_00100 [Clostridiales bacterium]|nr:hypothetical protein [Clostridiales bacterium]